MLDSKDVDAVRADYARCLTHLEVTSDASGRRTFRGTIHAAPTLVGPPGRLHGGMHPAVRLLAPLERLEGRALLDGAPLALALRMRKAILLDTTVPFEGSIETSADGRKLLRTRFDGDDRLDGTLVTPAPGDSASALARFAALYDEDLRGPELERTRGHGSLDTRVGERLVSARLDAAFWSESGVDYGRYLGPRRTIDPVFTSVVLDVIGAYTLGVEVRTRLYTTRFEFVVHGTAKADDGVFLLLGDRATEDVADSTIAKVDVGGKLVGERQVSVILADERFERALGYGRVALVPLRTR